MNKFGVLIGSMLVAALAGCGIPGAKFLSGTTGSGLLYVEPSVKLGDFAIRRVAIVPNRLPLNLVDPEKWRKRNWNVAKAEFVKRGFEVVDYETSAQIFEKSGLPVEDTKVSRDKYADLAQQLGVDLILVPYYGTFAKSKNIFLILNSFSFIGVATFQFYLAERNDFFVRIDASGENKYTTGIGTSSLGFTTFLGDNINEESGALGLGTLLSVGLFVVYDLLPTLKSSDSRWEAAFKKGVEEGLKPFFAAYPSPR